MRLICSLTSCDAPGSIAGAELPGLIFVNIGLRALGLGERVIDVLDREIQLILVPFRVDDAQNFPDSLRCGGRRSRDADRYPAPHRTRWGENSRRAPTRAVRLRCGHLKTEGDEQTGSQSYIPPDPKDDKALHTALDLIRGIQKNSAYPPNPKMALPN
jgi:hypothetical protein